MGKTEPAALHPMRATETPGSGFGFTHNRPIAYVVLFTPYVWIKKKNLISC